MMDCEDICADCGRRPAIWSAKGTDGTPVRVCAFCVNYIRHGPPILREEVDFLRSRVRTLTEALSEFVTAPSMPKPFKNEGQTMVVISNEEKLLTMLGNAMRALEVLCTVQPANPAHPDARVDGALAYWDGHEWKPMNNNTGHMLGTEDLRIAARVREEIVRDLRNLGYPLWSPY